MLIETPPAPRTTAAAAPHPSLATDAAWDALLPEGLGALVDAHLCPLVTLIDTEGLYPEAFLRELGVAGAYGGVAAPEWGGNGQGLAGAIAAMARVGEACLSTAFAVWCQTACARYIQLSGNDEAKAEWLPGLVSGWQLGGTGLSNTLKSASEIESYLLGAERVDGGYVINGTLPWVSNLGDDHIFVTGCPVQGDGRLVFFVVDCRQPGFTLVEGAHFAGLEGTRTLACQFRGVRIDDARVLAHPAESAAYMARIKPGMILAQMGMCLGLVRECISLIDESDRAGSHVNQFLDDRAATLRGELQAAEAQTLALAREAEAALPSDAPYSALMRRVLQLRLAGSELSLRAAQSALLHQGARGYLRSASAQRRLREAAFVAIVTPSIKHLRRELARTAPHA